MRGFEPPTESAVVATTREYGERFGALRADELHVVTCCAPFGVTAAALAHGFVAVHWSCRSSRQAP